MTKLTITRLGEPKEIGYVDKKDGIKKYFKKVGFQTQEYGDRWFDFAFRGEHGLTVGTSKEFEMSERQYNGKTYYDAKLPRQSKGGLSEDDKEILLNIQTGIALLRNDIQALRNDIVSREEEPPVGSPF